MGVGMREGVSMCAGEHPGELADPSLGISATWHMCGQLHTQAERCKLTQHSSVWLPHLPQWLHSFSLSHWPTPGLWPPPCPVTAAYYTPYHTMLPLQIPAVPQQCQSSLPQLLLFPPLVSLSPPQCCSIFLSPSQAHLHSLPLSLSF